MTVHLELMSKPKLIAIVRGARAAIARAEAEAAYWKAYADRVACTVGAPSPDAAAQWDMARMMLTRSGPDPDAAEHAATLDAEIETVRHQNLSAGAVRGHARRRTARTDLQESA